MFSAGGGGGTKTRPVAIVVHVELVQAVSLGYTILLSKYEPKQP